MLREKFISKLFDLSKKLGRRITEDYIGEIADIAKVKSWDDEVFDMLIRQWIMNPPKEINGDSICDVYYSICRTKLTKEYKEELVDPSDPIDEKHVRFFLKFAKWVDGKRMTTPESFRETCKYSARNEFEKDLIDEYIKGVLEYRNGKELPAWTK